VTFQTRIQTTSPQCFNFTPNTTNSNVTHKFTIFGETKTYRDTLIFLLFASMKPYSSKIGTSPPPHQIDFSTSNEVIPSYMILLETVIVIHLVENLPNFYHTRSFIVVFVTTRLGPHQILPSVHAYSLFP